MSDVQRPSRQTEGNDKVHCICIEMQGWFTTVRLYVHTRGTCLLSRQASNDLERFLPALATVSENTKGDPTRQDSFCRRDPHVERLDDCLSLLVLRGRESCRAERIVGGEEIGSRILEDGM